MASASANAIVVSIDDFDGPDVEVSDPLGGGPTTASDAVRTVAHDTVAGPTNGAGSTTKIGSQTFPAGALEVANDNGRDAEVTVTWTIAANLLPSNATNVGFFFRVNQSDGNPTSIDFSLNNAALANFSIAPNTINQDLSFGLNASQLAAVAAGGSLDLVINGAVGWDFSADSFGFSYDLPQQVSEPSVLALLGMGLALVVAGRRRTSKR